MTGIENYIPITCTFTAPLNHQYHVEAVPALRIIKTRYFAVSC